jgi:pimeloyl-ACP methyl ester carboxylesterase
MAFIQTRDNTRLYIKDWGAGPAVLLIHGWPLNADSWAYHAYHLAQAGYRVITYDRRGFGRSDQPWSGYDYDTLTNDVADIIEALHLNQVALVGFSMGGGEVVRYCSKYHSSKVSAVGLIGSVVPCMLKASDNPNGVDAKVFQDIQEKIVDDPAAFYNEFFNDFYGIGLIDKPVSSAYLEWTRTIALQAGLKGTLDCVDSFAKTDFRSDLQAIQVPALIVHGDKDSIVPIAATSAVTAKSISQAKYVVYEDGPHGLTATHKERLLQDLLQFLKAHQNVN